MTTRPRQVPRGPLPEEMSRVYGIVVVVVVLEVVVVVVGHGWDCGMQTSMTLSTSVRARVLADLTAARIVHLPGRVPLTRVRTLIKVRSPHTASVAAE
jgi:hypothetical protein